MIDVEKIRKACREIITSSYLENFQRQISEEEIATVFKHLIPRMDEELIELKGYSEVEFERYMNSKRNGLLFSPMNILSEFNLAITTVGADTVEKAGKYKRRVQLEVLA